MSDKIDHEVLLDRVIDAGDGIEMSWREAVGATINRWPPEIPNCITELRTSNVTGEVFFHCVVRFPDGSNEAMTWLKEQPVIRPADESDSDVRARRVFRKYAEFFSRLAEKK